MSNSQAAGTATVTAESLIAQLDEQQKHSVTLALTLSDLYQRYFDTARGFFPPDTAGIGEMSSRLYADGLSRYLLDTHIRLTRGVIY